MNQWLCFIENEKAMSSLEKEQAESAHLCGYKFSDNISCKQTKDY